MTSLTPAQQRIQQEKRRNKIRQEQDKKILGMEKMLSKLVRQLNVHTRSIRSLKATVHRQEAQIHNLDTKIRNTKSSK